MKKLLLLLGVVSLLSGCLYWPDDYGRGYPRMERDRGGDGGGYRGGEGRGEGGGRGGEGRGHGD